MKVSIDIDEDLMRRARRLTGLRTKREVIQRALQTLVQLKEQERIRRYRGKLRSSGDLERAANGKRSSRRRPGSAKGEIQILSPYAFKPFDEWPIGEILEWLPYLFTDAEIRKLRRADPKLSPRQVLKYQDRDERTATRKIASQVRASARRGLIGAKEGRARAARLIKANAELLRRLAGTLPGHRRTKKA